MLPTVLNYDLPSCSVHFSNSVRVQCWVHIKWRSTARGYRLVARTRLQSDRGLERIIDILHKYSLAVVVSSILIPDSSSTWAPLFTCTTEHFFWFQWRLISCIAPLVSFTTRFSLPSEAAKTFGSSIYKRSVTLTSIRLDNRYPSVAHRSDASGFRHRQSAQ